MSNGLCSMFEVKIRKTKHGWRGTVYEDGEFYAEVDAPTREEVERYVAHYVMVAQ